jgi:diadenylate cyclase
MAEILNNLFINLVFLFQRLNWLSILDIVLVTAIFFFVLVMVRDTQAVVLLRGVLFVIIVITLLTSLVNLPAFSWMVQTALPAFVLAIPVIFAPEIRRGLEKLGRAGSGNLLFRKNKSSEVMTSTIKAVVTSATRLSARKHGALIVMHRTENLGDYIQTGISMNASVTPELLLQIFYPNTPLHDGAVIISDGKVAAASCVMPLSASGILNRTPDRLMGLRHRAALGISEVTDAIAVVVSEETGSISIAHGGRMIRRLDSERLENLLMAFYRSSAITSGPVDFLRRLLRLSGPGQRLED